MYARGICRSYFVTRVLSVTSCLLVGNSKFSKCRLPNLKLRSCNTEQYFREQTTHQCVHALYRPFAFEILTGQTKSKKMESPLARLASVAFVCVNFVPGVWRNHSSCIHGQRLSCGMLSLWGRLSHIPFSSSAFRDMHVLVALSQEHSELLIKTNHSEQISDLNYSLGGNYIFLRRAGRQRLIIPSSSFYSIQVSFFFAEGWLTAAVFHFIKIKISGLWGTAPCWSRVYC